jgi:hypothetical protein
MARRARIPGIRAPVPPEDNRAFVRIEALTSSRGIFHPIGARLSPNSYGNRAVGFPIHFVTSTEREAEVVAALEKNQAPRELPWPGPNGDSPTPHYFVNLSTETKRRQAEPIVDISGFGWQYYAENPRQIAELWGVAAYFGPPEPDIPLLSWSPDRFSSVRSAREFAAGNSP